MNESEVKPKKNFDSFGNDLFDQTNLLLFKCYKQFNNANNIKKNIGFYFCGSIILIQIACAIAFMITGLNSIYLKFKVVIDQFYTSLNEKSITTQVDVDNCRFVDAKQKEERGIWKYFFILFVKQFSLINIFCFPNEYDILPISLSLFLFSVASDYMINALLFSDDVISQRYKNKGHLNPVTTYSLSIISNIVSSIICIIGVKLTNFSGTLELFAQEHQKEKEYVEKLKAILKIIRNKIILFFIYEFAMMGMYFYFMMIFCAVYKGSQLNWFTNGLTSNLLSLLTTLGISVLISILRYIGLYCNSERIYNISLYLNNY